MLMGLFRSEMDTVVSLLSNVEVFASVHADIHKKLIVVVCGDSSV